MAWHNVQFLHQTEVDAAIDSNKKRLSNIDPETLTEVEKVFTPGTNIKIAMVHRGKEHYVPAIVMDIVGDDLSATAKVATKLVDEIYTLFCFSDIKSLVLDKGD